MKARIIGVVCLMGSQQLNAQTINIEPSTFQNILLIRLQDFPDVREFSIHTDEACLSPLVSHTTFYPPIGWMTIPRIAGSFIKDHKTKECVATPDFEHLPVLWAERGTEPLPETAPEGQPLLKEVTESHLIPEPRPIDILWVIDSSGSMSEEQQFLANQFTSFAQQLQNSGRRFRMAVTSTDICEDTIPDDLKLRACPVPYGGSSSTRHRGSFVGPILEGENPDLANLFQSQALVGTNGSGFEHGLKAIDLAILKSEQGLNPTFPLDDSFLSIIMITDEEDDGIGLQMTDAYSGVNYTADGHTTFAFTPTDLVQNLESRFGIGEFSISAITGTRDASGELCTSDHSKPKEEGTAMIDAAKETGGVIHSICEPHWDDLLTTLAQDVSVQSDQIVLESQPLLTTLKVFHNDQAIPWNYISNLNAVRFHSTHFEAGDTIRIEYKTLVH